MNGRCAGPPDDVRVVIRSDPRLLASIRSLVGEWLSVFGVPVERRDELVLAVDEACSNAIRHAYGGCSSEQVELGLRGDPDWIEVEVCDLGATAERDRIEAGLEGGGGPGHLELGGRGVHLIRSAFDEVRFEPGSPCGNRVVMRLRRSG